MRAILSTGIIAFAVAFALSATTAQAGQILLGSSSIIGGNGSFGGSTPAVGVYDAGGYSALKIVDNQTGAISEPSAGNYWLGPDLCFNNYIVIDLGSPYLLEQIDLFNTHNSAVKDRDTNTFKIEASNAVSYQNDTIDYDLSGGVQILSGSLANHCAAGQTDPIEADTFTSTNGLATGDTYYQYLKFTALSAHPDIGTAGPQGLGLNEIRVYGVPEPGTLMLLLIGALGGVAWLVRQRRRTVKNL